MAVVGRVIVVMLALLIAMLGAGLTIALGVAMPDLGGVDTDPFERASFFALAFFATGLAGMTALLPAFALVVLAEAFRIRSVLYYATVGAAVGLLALYGSNFTGRVEYSTDIEPLQHGPELIAAAGIVAGFVYWLLAGRNAGKWRDRYNVSDPRP